MYISMICETKFHLFNCINYIYNTLEHDFPGEKVYVDLFIRTPNVGDNDMINRLIHSFGFGNVYVYSYDEIDFEKSIRAYLYKIKKFVSPGKYLESISSWTRNNTKHYSYIYVAYHSPFVYAFSLYFPHAHIRFFDDGLGTYTDTVPEFNIYKGKLRYWILCCRSPWTNIDRIYVNNKAMCSFSQAHEIIQLERITDHKDTWLYMKYVFSFKETDVYDKSKTVFLTQPHQNQLFYDFDTDIYKIVMNSHSDIITKLHPLYDPKRTDGFSKIDEINNMWELTCAKSINDTSILIGQFSTAQVMPKILYDREPFIIFTYKLYENEFSNEKKKEFENFIETFRGSYTNADKIMCPDSFDELRFLLDRNIK